MVIFQVSCYNTPDAAKSKNGRRQIESALSLHLKKEVTMYGVCNRNSHHSVGTWACGI